MAVRQMTPAEVAAALESKDPPLLLDVRTPGEHRCAAIEGAVLIPMDTLATRLDELDPDRPTIVMCHHGFRSNNVAHYLAARGFSDIANLIGGIERYSREIDPRVPRY
ncbi:MAG: sulfurtransferase [Myxococcales bacterium]|nr:sulfurtransferase [Myxococcales bacterium]MCB9542688.1 sulfurtransferase [Myxococcales bacterium]MCB9552860.1 sulfurtransferase [Myxococcales bacterium]